MKTENVFYKQNAGKDFSLPAFTSSAAVVTPLHSRFMQITSKNIEYAFAGVIINLLKQTVESGFVGEK